MSEASSRSSSPGQERVKRQVAAFLRNVVNPFSRGDHLEPFNIKLSVSDRWRLVFLCLYYYGLLPKDTICDGMLYLSTTGEEEIAVNVPSVYYSYSLSEQEAINEVIEQIMAYNPNKDSWGSSEHWRDFPNSFDPPSTGFHALIHRALELCVDV